MKHLIFLLALTLGLIGSVSAQNHGYIGEDTLTVSSAVDTIYLHVGGVDVSDARPLSNRDELELYIRLDSLSGDAGGTLTIEYTDADDPTEFGVEWYTPYPATSYFVYMNGATATAAASTSAVSFTTNGTRTTLLWKDPNFNANHARARYVVASSSQSIRMRGWYSVR